MTKLGAQVSEYKANNQSQQNLMEHITSLLVTAEKSLLTDIQTVDQSHQWPESSNLLCK